MTWDDQVIDRPSATYQGDGNHNWGAQERNEAMATFTLTGDVTHDESAGLQTSAVATTTEDNNDNDVATLSALLANYAAGYNRLFNAVAAGGLGLTRPEDTTRTTDGQAVAQVFTMANAGSVTDLAFTTSGGQPLNGTASGFRTTTDKTIRLYTDTLNNIALGKYDSDGNGSDDATAFALVLEEVRDSNNVITAGKIWIIQFEPIEHTNTGSHDEALDLTNILYVTASEEVVFTDLSKAPSGQNDWLGFGPTGSTADVQLLATGLNPAIGDTVNTSTIGLGSNSQSVDPATDNKVAEGIRVDFTKGLNLPPQGGGTGDTDDINGISFTQHEQGSGAAFRLVQVQGNANNRVDARIKVFNADEDQGSGWVSGLADDPGVNVGLVEVYLVTTSKQGVETKTLVRSQNGPAGAETGSDANVHITISGNTVDVTGLKTNYEVVVRSASGTNVIDRIEITNTTVNTSQDNANGFDVGAFRLLGVAGVTQEVGSRTNFEDDGPSIDLTLVGTARLTLDETDNDSDDNQVGGILATASISAASLLSGTVSFGSDGEAGTSANVFSLVLGGADNNSGLDTVAGTDILLFKEGNDIIGRAGSAAGAMVFKIEIDASTGTVTATQYLAIKHDDATDPDESDDATDASATTVLQTIATGRVNVSREITDGDGDKASDTQDISSVFNFEDDGPSAFNPADIVADDGVKNQAGQSATRDLTGSNTTTVRGNYTGSDGFGSLGFANIVNGTTKLQGTIGTGSLQTLQSGGDDIYLFFQAATASSLATLTATTDNDNSDATARVFTIQLNDAAASDSYTFNMLGRIDNNQESLFLNFAGQKQTIYEWLTLDFPGNDPGDVDDGDPGTTIDPDERDGDVLFTGIAHDGNNGIVVGPGVQTQINVSSTGIGVSDQSIDGDSYKIMVNGQEQTVTLRNGVFIDFVDGATRTLDGQAPISQIDFDNHYNVNNSGFAISQLKPNNNAVVDVRVSVYDEAASDPADSASEITNDTAKEILSVTVQARNAQNVVTDDETFTADNLAGVTIGGRLITVDFQSNDTFVEIDGMGERYSVLIETADGFERIRVDNVGTANEGFDISGIFIEQVDAGDPINMKFDLLLADGDGDTVLMNDVIDVTLAPPDLIA